MLSVISKSAKCHPFDMLRNTVNQYDKSFKPEQLEMFGTLKSEQYEVDKDKMNNNTRETLKNYSKIFLIVHDK